MPAVLSTLREQLFKVTGNSEVYEAPGFKFCMPEFDGPSPTAYTYVRDLIDDSNVVPIPVLTYDTLYVLHTRTGAYKSQCDEALYGLCTFIFPQTPGRLGLTDMVHGSKICFCPRMVEQVAFGYNPKVVDTKLLKHLKDLRRKYPLPPEPTPCPVQPQVQDDRAECCICMAADAEYKWSNCSHGGSPLVCLHCRNLVISRSEGRPSACPICRTQGEIVKLGLHAPRKTNTQPWGRPIKGTKTGKHKRRR